MTTPTPVLTSEPMTSSIPTLPDFASLFEFNQRVSALEQELYQVKQVDHFAQILAQIPAIVDEHLSTINESLENVVWAKSSSQLQSTYEAATSLTEDLYDALVKSYHLDKDLFGSYGKVYSLKRGREDKDKDEDPLVGSDQGLKKRKTSKDAEPSRGSKSKESKSSSSKGSKSQSKSSGKSA
ncbi:hypothetical protein Tco_0834064 [Tanacetum coccineum]